MSELPAPANLDNYRDFCAVCKRRIIRCFDSGGRSILLESVDFGRGRMAITRDLVDQRLLAQSTNQATSYRKHGCPTAVPAFSAAGFKRKGGI